MDASFIKKYCIIRTGMQSMSSILIIQFGSNFLDPNSMYLENYILKMIRHQTVKNQFFTNTFFSYKENDRPIVVTLYNDVVMLQRAQGGCLGTESR